MNLRKIILSAVFVWLSGVGYLTWYNGLKSTGRYKGFNWEEWIWFGLVPVLLSAILYFIWKPESFKKRRMGVILSTGKNVDEAKLKASEAKSLLSVKLK